MNRNAIAWQPHWCSPCWRRPGARCAPPESTADVVFEWNQILQDTVPGAGRRPDAPLLRDDAHRDVRRDQRHRARVRAVSRPAAALGRRIARGRGGAGRARRARRHQPGRRRDLRRGARAAARNAAVGLRPPRRGGRRPRRQGDPGVAAERRLGGLAVPGLCRAAAARTLAADAAEQPGRGVHASSERRADGAADGDAVPAAAAAVADQRALRRRPERGQAHRQVRQRDPHAASRPRSRGCGPASRRPAPARPPTSCRSGTTSLATWRASAGCRWSRPPACSRS